MRDERTVLRVFGVLLVVVALAFIARYIAGSVVLGNARSLEESAAALEREEAQSGWEERHASLASAYGSAGGTYGRAGLLGQREGSYGNARCLARSAWHSGDMAKAAEAARALTELTPKDEAAWSMLVNSLVRQGRDGEADECRSRAQAAIGVDASARLGPAPRAAEKLGAHGGEVLGIAWSDDGSRLLSGGRDSTVVLWGLGSGPAKTPLEVPELDLHLQEVALRGDGSTAAALLGIPDPSVNAQLAVWRLPNSEVARVVELGRCGAATESSLGFCAKGSILAAGSGDGAHLYSENGFGSSQFVAPHIEEASAMALSPDGKTLAWGTWIHGGELSFETIEEALTKSNPIEIEDVATGKTVRRIFPGHWHPASHVSFSPDGSLLAASFYVPDEEPSEDEPAGMMPDYSIRVWDVASGKQRFRLAGHEAYVNDFAFTRDGSLIVSCSADNTVKLWSAVSGNEVASFAIPGVVAAALSPGGWLLATGHRDGSVKLWVLWD